MRIFALLTLGLALQLATSAQAQNATKPANEVLITLGTTGGPIPRFERAGISTLIQVNGKSYLFDAGAGMTRSLAGAKVSLLDIQKIFLTHLHDDHYSGLADFAGQLSALKPEKTIDIYGPGLTKSVVEGLHAFMYANRLIRETERKFPHRIDIYVAHEIKPGEVYKDENIRVTAIENHHFHFPNGSPPDGKTTSLSYRIETPNRAIVITGDTGAFEGLATFASGADLFVTEVIDPEDIMNLLQSLMKEKMSKETYEARKFHMEEEHMTPESIAKLATEAKVKSVVLTHLVPGLKGESAYEEWAKKVRAGFPGDVFAAKDLDRY